MLLLHYLMFYSHRISSEYSIQQSRKATLWERETKFWLAGWL